MRHGHVIGIELNEKMCQVSFYDEGLREPEENLAGEIFKIN